MKFDSDAILRAVHNISAYARDHRGDVVHAYDTVRSFRPEMAFARLGYEPRRSGFERFLTGAGLMAGGAAIGALAVWILSPQSAQVREKVKTTATDVREKVSEVAHQAQEKVGSMRGKTGETNTETTGIDNQRRENGREERAGRTGGYGGSGSNLA